LAAATLIGIDVGTTAVKAILIDAGGTTLQTFAASYPTARPQPGHVEQDPADWLNGVLAALAAFSERNDLGSLLGIGLCSQVSTHVFVDAAGEPLLPAFVWQDGRCSDEAAALDERITAAEKLTWFGGPMPIDASHALSRMAYVARIHPGLYVRTRAVLLPKDYCALKLTGGMASDPIAAVALVDDRLAYLDDLIAMVPGARDKLPPLRDFTDRVGAVRPGLPCAGAPVFVGTMDAWSGMFGIGVTGERDAMYLSGTSEVLGMISAARVPTPGVIVFPPYGGITLHVAPTQAGGASLSWLTTLVGRSADELSALAASVPPSARVPLFLPHLQGERAPLWDIRSRGAFARLDSATGPGELARAVMEGVAFSARLAFEAVEASTGSVVDELHLGGGGSRSDIWCQIRADVLAKTLRRAKVLDAGTVGAAIIAGLGSGTMPSLAAATESLVAFDRTFEPHPQTRAYYDDKFAKYRELYARLKPFNEGYR
jgi:xylulokinase